MGKIRQGAFKSLEAKFSQLNWKPGTLQPCARPHGSGCAGHWPSPLAAPIIWVLYPPASLFLPQGLCTRCSCLQECQASKCSQGCCLLHRCLLPVFPQVCLLSLNLCLWVSLAALPWAKICMRVCAHACVGVCVCADGSPCEWAHTRSFTSCYPTSPHGIPSVPTRGDSQSSLQLRPPAPVTHTVASQPLAPLLRRGVCGWEPCPPSWKPGPRDGERRVLPRRRRAEMEA